ncbi:hypothetical protein F5884DRAFT_783397 [Xylogone sp. PMI_703]|nr:hypothetical protein F5884DRAFT_783397 [Xylogone sp. PMI_703]
MSNIISEFFINPVLQQARRFSRSSTPTDPVEPLKNERNHRTTAGSSLEDAIEDTELEVNEDDYISNALRDEARRGIQSESPRTSPGLNEVHAENILAQSHTEEAHAHSAIASSFNALPIRQASVPGSSMEYHVNDTISYDTPAGVQAVSSMDTSLGRNANIPSLGNRHTESSSSESLHDAPQANDGICAKNGLPEDDGMGHLRKQILEIQDMDIGAEAKARMVHQLLMQGYNQTNAGGNMKVELKPPSPTGVVGQERPTTPGSLSSLSFWQYSLSPDATSPSQNYTFHLSPDDLKRTYAPIVPTEEDDFGYGVTERTKEGPVLGCKHYKRNVKLQCSTCDRWYTCRLCHDEVEDHVLIRKETKNMLCMLCGSAQRAGEFCVKCGERAAWYYCPICKLWDNDPNKNIYHCNDCGICRKGLGLGKDFFHCKTCGVCMSMSVETSHKCIERVSDCDCPICGEYMFTSLQPVVFMVCGHSIHQSCYYEHMKTSYKCPICNRSTLNMETQFRNLDRAIEAQPMPPQFQDTKAMVSCNDCYAKSAAKYHWLGLKCAICDSYNTVQLSILSGTEATTAGENIEADRTTLADHSATGVSTPLYARTESGRSRRFSSQTLPVSTSSSIVLPYATPLRLGRSVSPTFGAAFPDDMLAIETDESGDEDEPDFWGRDTSRSPAFIDNVEGSDDGEDDDEESIADECDEEDGDEEDQFELIGHR